MVFWKRWKFGMVLIISEVVFGVLFGTLVDYDTSILPNRNTTNLTGDPFYPEFQDVHVMIFIGFGFLMTFLAKYGFSSAGFNFLIGAFVIQWALLVRGVIHMVANGESTIQITITDIMNADFSAATILISFGAVLGKAGPLQLIIMATIEVILSNINEYIGIHIVEVSDVGGSIFIHAFGAYFGLCVSRVLFSEDIKASTKEGSIYHSDLFSLIGTIFLWLYWPSFNSGPVVGAERHRTIINTYLSLAACCVVTFAVSAMVDKKGKLDVVHIQNATLAGGVAVGTTANLMIYPWGAIVIGSVAAIVSVLGFTYLMPLLHRKVKVHDTCGVNNLHGMPGILAALGGAVVASIATEDVYGDNLYHYFPARAPSNMTFTDDVTSMGRDASKQAMYQFLALLMTLCMASVGGILTGFILKLPIWDQPKGDELFDDALFWNLPDDVTPSLVSAINAGYGSTGDRHGDRAALLTDGPHDLH